MKSVKNILSKVVVLGFFSISAIAQADSWSYGKIKVVESFGPAQGSIIMIRWDGPNSESCTEHDVEFDSTTLGGDAAFERGFNLAISAALSDNNIRFNLDGCSSQGRQKAKVVQLCTNDCSF